MWLIPTRFYFIKIIKNRLRCWFSCTFVMPIAANLGLFFWMSILLVESLMKALQHAPARRGNPQFWE
jgi:hypothetical protein